MLTAYQPISAVDRRHLGRDSIVTTSLSRATAPIALDSVLPPPADRHLPLPPSSSAMEDPTTPTNESFARTALAAQKPLPTGFPDSAQNPDTANEQPSRPHSYHSRHSREPGDMNVNDSDGETAPTEDAVAASDDESVAADGTKPGKKKRSQRFYCTDYPPCNLSFTRSEHLARHIRKHTGERPFQCHCSRRFSRLDNLRQHAQTVHVNEDIPIDSLAATGTRFQRQIRTDRVRPTSGRARTSTAGNIGPPMRGHSKSLSTSSLASVASVSSVASSVYSTRDDLRRRPPPLVMAEPRSRLSLESPYRAGPDGSYRPLTPTEYSTPTSATFSKGPGSPRWGSAMVSPSPSHSRSHSLYSSGVRTPGRRLSVPSSTVNPFQSPQTVSTSRTLFSQGPVNASNSGLFSSPNNNSLLTSPTTSTASSWSRRDSASTSADEAWRRRTWHPDTREFSNSVAANNNNNNNSSSSNNNLVNSPPAGGSRFSQIIASSQYQTSPVTSLPIANPATQQMNLRLPGIESFDPIPHHRPVSPLRRAPSPMIVDSDNSPAVGLAAQPSMLRNVESPPDDRRISTGSQWDSSLHRGLTRLDIASGTPPRDSAQSWANEANRAVMAQAEQTLGNYPKQQQQQKLGVRFESDVRMVPAPDAPSMGYSRGHQHTMSAPSFNAATPRQLKRQGWYNGPVSSAAMPGTEFQVGDRGVGSRVERMVHPNLANGFSGFSGFPSRVPQTVHEHQQSPPPPPQDSQHYTRQQQEQDVSDPLSRLEALVAVATSEATAAAAY